MPAVNPRPAPLRPVPVPAAAAWSPRPARLRRSLRNSTTFAAALALHVGALGHWSTPVQPPQPLPMAPLLVDLIEAEPPPSPVAAAPVEPEPPAEPEPESEPPAPVEPPPQAITEAPKPPPPPLPKPKPKPVVQPKPKPQPRSPAPTPARSDAPPSPLPPAPAPVASAAPTTPASFSAAYLRNPPPRYPSESRSAGEAGRVLLRVRVTAEGRAESVEIAASSGHARLDEAALAAVRRWRFTPAQQAGAPVAATVTVPILFKLES